MGTQRLCLSAAGADRGVIREMTIGGMPPMALTPALAALAYGDSLPITSKTIHQAGPPTRLVATVAPMPLTATIRDITHQGTNRRAIIHRTRIQPSQPANATSTKPPQLPMRVTHYTDRPQPSSEASITNHPPKILPPAENPQGTPKRRKKPHTTTQTRSVNQYKPTSYFSKPHTLSRAESQWNGTPVVQR